MTDNDSDPLAYLVALRNHKWHIPMRRRILWAIRRRVQTKVQPITMEWFGGPVTYSRSDGGLWYPNRRDFTTAVKDRDLRSLKLLVVCWVRGHNLPMQECLRCGIFIP